MGEVSQLLSYEEVPFERFKVILPRSPKGSLGSFLQSDDHRQRATACAGQQLHRREQSKPAPAGSRGKGAFFPAHITEKANTSPILAHAPLGNPAPLCSPQAGRQACPTRVLIARSILQLGVSFNTRDCSGNTPATVLFSNHEEG